MWTKLFSRSEINYALSNTLCPYFIIFKIKLHHLICYKTQSVPELSAVQKYNSPVAHRVSQLVRIKTARYWTVFLLIFNMLSTQIAVLLYVFIRHILPLISSFFLGGGVYFATCLLHFKILSGERNSSLKKHLKNAALSFISSVATSLTAEFKMPCHGQYFQVWTPQNY